MDTTEFKSFLQQCILNYDPNADVSDGSDYDTSVVQPTMAYLGTVPQDRDPVEFVMERMRHYNPSDLVDEGDALTDLAVKPLATILDPLFWELSRIRNGLTFRYPDRMTREEAASLGANLFLSLTEGTYTMGVVRLYFASPSSQSVNETNLITTVSGTTFIPAFSQSTTKEDMFYRRSGLYYYWDVTVRATEPGATVVGKGDVVSIDGLEAAVAIKNLNAFTTGGAKEEVADFLTRGAEALTERSLVTAKGVYARVRDLFTDSKAVEVAGLNDIEMDRDAIEYQESGDRGRIPAYSSITFPLTLVLGASDTIIVETDDGMGGAYGPFTLTIAGIYANIVEIANAINSAWQAAGGGGCIASSWGDDKLLMHSGMLISTSYSHLDTYIKLTNPSVQSAWSLLGFVNSQLGVVTQGTAGLILSAMPGGLLRPNRADGTYAPEEMKYHVGGCTDVYLMANSVNEEEGNFTDVEDEKPVWMGTELVVNPTIASSDRVRELSRNDASARVGRPNWSSPVLLNTLDIQEDFLAAKSSIQVEPGDLLSIRDHATLASTAVIAATRTQDSDLSTNDLRVNRKYDGATVTGLSYHITASTRMNLVQSKRRLKISSMHGTGLQCYGASPIVSWLPIATTGIDTNQFARYGVAANDILVIYEKVNGEVSENVGEYTILSLAANQLTLSENLVAVEQVCFAVYEGGEGSIQRPLLRVKSVELLDALEASTGAVVPYATPLLIQCQGLSGAREKLEGWNGILDHTNPLLFEIPNSYRKFTEMGIKEGDVIALSQSTAFPTLTFRKVATVSDYTLTFTRTLGTFSGDYTDVYFSIGSPAAGKARLYFQDPVSFEMSHAWDKLTILNNMQLSPYEYRLGIRDTDGVVRREFELRSKGAWGGRRIYPALGTGEDPEVWNLDLDKMPSFAQDDEIYWAGLAAGTPSAHGIFDFSELVCREELIRPSIYTTVYNGGDAMLLWPERLLGQLGTYTSYVKADMEKNHARRAANLYAMFPEGSPNTVKFPTDFFLGGTVPKGLTDSPSTVQSVEGKWGQLEGCLFVIREQPDGLESPNVGGYRIDSVPVPSSVPSLTAVLKKPGDTANIQHTDPLVEYCGRASFDQTACVINGGAGAGTYLVGETVTYTNGGITITAKVSRWYFDAGVPANSLLWLYDVNRLDFPAAGANIVGSVSGASRPLTSFNFTSLARGFYDIPNSKNILRFQFIVFNTAAPGYINATITGGDPDLGPWQIGNFVYLYGAYGGGTTHAQAEAVNSNAGAWRIVAVENSGFDIVIESVADPSKQLVDTVGYLMGWAISEGQRPMERVGVYESYPTPLLIDEVVYEDAVPAIHEGRLQVIDPDDLFISADGRAYAGVACPYQIARPGKVRMSSTEMSNHTQDGLYFMEVDIASKSPSTDNNLAPDTELECLNSPHAKRGAYTGAYREYEGEGYVVEVDDHHLSYSMLEDVRLCMNTRFLKTGDPDLESNKVILSDVGLGVRYERVPLVESLDSVVSSDSERTTCASLLARHFTPAHVRLAMEFSGNISSIKDLETALRDYINNRTGSDRIEVSDLEALVSKAGADYINQDYAVIAIFEDLLRRRTAARSRNYIGGDEIAFALRHTTNRISHFIADLISLRQL